MTTHTPFIEAVLGDEPRLYEFARETYRAYDLTELEVVNLVGLASISHSKEDINRLKTMLSSVCKRSTPLP